MSRIYEIELEDGRTLEIEADEPSQEKPSSKPSSMESQNKFGQFMNVPGAANRAAIMAMGQGQNPIEAYQRGAIQPSSIPKFQDYLPQRYMEDVANTASKIPNEGLRNLAVGGSALLNPALATAGSVADFVTNPAEIALSKVGSKVIEIVGKTGAGQAVARFFSKPRSFLKFGKDAVLNIAEKGSAGVDKLDDIVGKKYEDGIQSISGTQKNLVPIQESIDDVVASYPEEKFTQFEKIKNRLAVSDGLSASELRDLKQEIKKGIPKGVFKGTVDPTPIQYAKLKVYNAVDNSLAELGGEKYIGMKKEYSEWKNLATDARKLLLEDGRPGDSKLRNWMGFGAPRRQMKALEEINKKLPPKEQFLQDFLAWRRGQALKTVALGGGGIMMGDYLVRRAVGGAVSRSSDNR